MVRLTRRSCGHHRGAFARKLERLEGELEANSKDPAADGGVCEGGLEEREHKAGQRVQMLSKLVEDGYEADKTCPWVARNQRSARRLKACSLGLSEKLERMKCALEELEVMVDVQRLLGRLDRGVGSSLLIGEQQRDSSEKGQESGASGGEEELECRSDQGGFLGGRNGGAGVTPVIGGEVSGRHRGHSRGRKSRGRKSRGRGYWRGSSQGVEGGLPPRLLTRVNALAERSHGGTATQATRCVFRRELKQWHGKLALREQETLDQIRFHLDKWDLRKVNEALAQLRLLECTGLVEGFEAEKKDTRSKVWRLRQELKVSREGYFLGRSHLCWAGVKRSLMVFARVFRDL